jgi:hypothetical protein
MVTGSLAQAHYFLGATCDTGRPGGQDILVRTRHESGKARVQEVHQVDDAGDSIVLVHHDQ